MLAARVLVTLPGLESFLIGECKALGVPVGAVDDGWIEVDGDAGPAIAGAGTLRAVVDVLWQGPDTEIPSTLPPARRLWYEAQWINQGARSAAACAAAARAAGHPEVLAHPDGPPGMVCLVNRQGTVLLGTALAWGLERRRPYRVALMARSLNPAMGRALAMASRARAGQSFCDPFCGSGTVLAERALLGPCHLVGVDGDPRALDAAGRTLSGFVAQGMATADLRAGDARRLDGLETGSVDAVATNPPFGHRLGEVTNNAQLYPAAFRAAARILRPRGRLVVLTADRRHLRQALAACGRALRLRSEVRVWLGGLEPTLGVYDRTEYPVV